MSLSVTGNDHYDYNPEHFDSLIENDDWTAAAAYISFTNPLTDEQTKDALKKLHTSNIIVSHAFCIIRGIAMRSELSREDILNFAFTNM